LQSVIKDFGFPSQPAPETPAIKESFGQVNITELVRNDYHTLILLHISDVLMAQNNSITGANNIDERTMRDIMSYLQIDDHDLFVGYIKRLGIDHKD
jgi:hypothetical protein